MTNAFTADELSELSALTSDRVHGAIEAGDKEQAHAMLDRLVEETRFSHDSMLLWLTALQSFVYREMGFDAFERSLQESFQKTGLAIKHRPKPADPSFRDKVLAKVVGLRNHALELEIEEDEEKVTLAMKGGCGSGARLLNMGFYDGEGGELIREAKPLTFNRKDFPVYCTHCALQQIPVAKAGKPFPAATIPDSDLRRGACKFHVYKEGHSAPPGHVETLLEKQPS